MQVSHATSLKSTWLEAHATASNAKLIPNRPASGSAKIDCQNSFNFVFSKIIFFFVESIPVGARAIFQRERNVGSDDDEYAARSG